MKLPTYPNSSLVRNGYCGALLNDDSECHLPAGHLSGDLPHCAHDPSTGVGWIEYDDDGKILARSGEGQSCVLRRQAARSPQ